MFFHLIGINSKSLTNLLYIYNIYGECIKLHEGSAVKPPFVLSQTDERPMYRQIMERIRHQIITGQWGPDQTLPSIRELAVSIQVSVITVKRAYQELESEGAIYTRPGRGSFVSRKVEPAAAGLQRELRGHLREVARLSKLLGLSENELKGLISNELKVLQPKRDPKKSNGGKDE